MQKAKNTLLLLEYLCCGLWKGYTVEVPNLQHPLQVLVVIRINSLYVIIGHLHSKDVLVEGPSEINIQQLPIK